MPTSCWAASRIKTPRVRVAGERASTKAGEQPGGNWRGHRCFVFLLGKSSFVSFVHIDRIPELPEGADEQARFDLIHEAVSEVHILPDKNPRKERVVANVTFKCPVRFFWEEIPGVADAYTPMTPDSLGENSFRDDEAHVGAIATPRSRSTGSPSSRSRTSPGPASRSGPWPRGGLSWFLFGPVFP